MKYRRDIDGLRAVAVVPVILFHAGATIFSGGFLGVDIFFVISGYLITGILLAELDRGDFSILRFYERRARRILPALFAVMACCIPFAWLWMLPNQFVEFAHSLIAVVLFVSNMLFWHETGYFATEAELRPLLHTWSLAVEEQYYLLFPITLALLWRFGRRWMMWAVVLAALFSLGLSEWASRHAESANFFLAPTRAWELLAGSICAFLLFGREPYAKGLPALAGLALIVFSIFGYSESTPLPGLYALAPVGGTALIILFGGPGTMVARLLSAPVLVGLGLISYSSYLWHQPLFAFARLQSFTEPSPIMMAVLAAVSLGLAAVSWRYVEQPFRKGDRSLLPSRKSVFVVSGIGGAALITCGLAIALLRLPAQVEFQLPPQLIENAPLPPGSYRPMPCEGLQSSEPVPCNQYGNGPRRIVIWGDSHALMLNDVAHAIPGATVYILGQWGCPPLIGVARQDKFGNYFLCDKIGVLDQYARYIESLHPEKVYLAARWTIYINGLHMQSRLQRDTHYITDGREKFDGASSSAEVVETALVRTVSRLSRIAHVYLVQQVPDLHAYSPRGIVMLASVPRAPIEAWHAREGQILAKASLAGAQVISTHNLMCGRQFCRTRMEGVRGYKDDNHLSYFASAALYDALARSF